MSIVRVGSTGTYAQNWDAIFGGKKAVKKAAKKSAKKKSAKKRK